MDAVILAAGNGSRFGGHKLSALVGGTPMYTPILSHCLALQQLEKLSHIVVVTQHGALQQTIEGLGLEVICNRAPQLGISHSIRLGLQRVLEINPQSTSCLFAVSDQPYLQRTTLEGLMDGYLQGHRGIALCQSQEKEGNPVIFHRRYYDELLQLEGDRGGKQVVRRHQDDVLPHPVQRRELEDLDVPLYQLRDNQPTLVSSEEAFPFLYRERLVVTVVGAGGKSSLLRHLAEQTAQLGRRTLVTTTTHIYRPEDGGYAETKSQIQNLWDRGRYAVVGTPTDWGKLKSLPENILEYYLDWADVVLIEGDGAKHHPCKVPASHEPVIHPRTDVVVAVLGMSALGNPLSEVCFRSQLAYDLLGKEGQELLTWQDFVTILTSPQGGRKGVDHREYYPLVNQWDGQNPQGAEILRTLQSQGIANGVLSCLPRDIHQNRDEMQ